MRPRPALGGPAGASAGCCAAALAAAALAAGAVWLALADDRELADSYRETLAVADGEYFDAAPLELPGGRKAGYVYGYQGRASWVLAVVYDGVEPGGYLLELVTRDGERLPLRELVVDDEGRGSAGGGHPGPLRARSPRSGCSTAAGARSPTPSSATEVAPAAAAAKERAPRYPCGVSIPCSHDTATTRSPHRR